MKPEITEDAERTQEVHISTSRKSGEIWGAGGGGRNDNVRLNARADSWARASATTGAAVWAGMAVLARVGMMKIGAIELLFSFAPLVVVPLGMELGRVMDGSSGCLEGARRIQPLGAAMAVVALCMPPGRTAAMVALGWLVVCGLMAGDGVIQMLSLGWRDAGRSARATLTSRAKLTFRAALAVAKIDLAVGGAWLVASRLGMRPMGIQEPIGLLTAVHFHYAGFATAMIAAATLQFAGRQRRIVPPVEKREGWGSQGPATQEWGSRWLWVVVLTVVGMPFVVAVGFVVSPALKMGAGVVFAVSVAALAVFLRGCGKQASDATARVLLQVAAGAVFAGMVLAGAYAVADFVGSEALTIPQMARTHGLLNGFGFCLLGLLGWLIETRGQGSGGRGQ
jgi:hypothetical protein